jgi:hypothetical protein
MARIGIPGAVWVETGTYKGDTTKFLSASAEFVYSLEPSATYGSRAEEKFSRNQRVAIIRKSSEEAFAPLVESLSGDVCFWLDGHYSGGDTFQGATESPIRFELKVIESSLERFDRCVVLIDDFRCFSSDASEYSSYPTKDFLVDFAGRNSLSWTVEHDIFCCWKS